MNETLHQAFALFSTETARLEKAYAALRDEFSHLTKELAAVVEHLTDGLLLIDSKGNIVLYNEAAARLLGQRRDEVIGLPYADLFPDTLFGFSVAGALLRERVTRTLFLTFDERDVEVTASHIPEIGLLLTCRDVTRLRQLQETLSRTDRLRALGEMAASLAHEIRNPLGGIEGFAALLAEDLKESPKQREMARNIVIGSRIINRLISDTLDYARPLTCEFRTVDLNCIAQEAVDSVRASCPERTITLKTHPTPLQLLLDPDLFKRALLNLLYNALDATKAGGEVALVVDNGSISVTDSGPGIEEPLLEKIFTPFFTTKTQGTGLGLAEAQKVVNAHGGALTVTSKVGQGSTFTIRVPCLSNAF